MPVEFQDIEGIDPDYYRSLKQLLDTSGITDCLDLTFSVNREEFGRSRVVDLVPGGRDIEVTEQNKSQYVQALSHHRMTAGIEEQIQAFLKGFYDLIPPELISMFNERELELLISGLPDIDMDDWQRNTEYVGCTSDSPFVKWFWEVARALPDADKALLLQVCSRGISPPYLSPYVQPLVILLMRILIFPLAVRYGHLQGTS